MGVMNLKNIISIFIIGLCVLSPVSLLRASGYGYLYIEVDPPDAQIQIDENFRIYVFENILENNIQNYS